MFQVSNGCLSMCLKLHISQGCFCPRIFFKDIGLNLLPWSSLVSGLHYHLALSAGVLQALWLFVFVAFGSIHLSPFILQFSPLE